MGIETEKTNRKTAATELMQANLYVLLTFDISKTGGVLASSSTNMESQKNMLEALKEFIEAAEQELAQS